TERLREGNAGLNQQFISIVANLRKVSDSTVLKEFSRVIEDSQKSVRAKLQAKPVEETNDRNAISFGRLVQAVDLASVSLRSLHDQASALGDIFTGRV